ncbi:hypothetical protein B7R21_12355 [Subtercola boreus]|uniref:Uncharacterized protein n=1 Tax=Subtercola boreus TaxID=120213 RepID=A0A3E0VNC5_9MICO|nr:hypothetical protein B7R21_12355 [Subtercola boreus]
MRRDPKSSTVRTVAADKEVQRGRLAKARQHAKGQDHQDSVALLASVDRQASNHLALLLGMKTRAGYGHDPVNEASLVRAERAARALVEKASL